MTMAMKAVGGLKGQSVSDQPKTSQSISKRGLSRS